MEIRTNIFVDGAWRPSAGTVVDVLSPADEQKVGETVDAGTADVDAAVSAARTAFDGWRALPAASRAKHLLSLRDELLTDLEQISEVVTRESGTPISISRSMQRNATDRLRYYAEHAGRVSRVEERLGKAARARIVQEPVGVAALLTPWNGAYASALTKIAPALLAGCTVVLKPPLETPLASMFIADAAQRSGLPAGVLNIVTGGRSAGELLVEHPDVQKIAMTGSVAGGQAIMRSASDRLKRLTLELGGKSACVVLPGADLAAAADQVVKGSMFNTGQACVAWTRLLIQQDDYERFVELLGAAIDRIRPLNPMDPSSTFGPITTPAQLERIEGFVTRALTEGARIVTGGSRVEAFDRGSWYQPTLLRDVHNHMEIARNEVFGPVTVAIPYTTVDDAVAQANDSDYGLSGAVLGDQDQAEKVAQRLESGTVSINCFTLEDHAPFGGRKLSGLGREWGPEGIDAYLESKVYALPF
ncbi:aldehyde dehydrogenase family protein [Nocardia fusca]|uniref:aldehyde dehydrogenase family protein n=1 Tax=Nocardia fusca TaxID=941183 RepID=UPI0007A73EB3|nr:aldehyde dehydrogenase family protein [Nocardia fusca]